MNPLFIENEKAGAIQSQSIPAIILPDSGITLYPVLDGKVQYDAPTCENLFLDNDVMTTESAEAFAYLHASVLRSRFDKNTDSEGDPPTFLAELDLKPSLCSGRLTMAQPIHTRGLAYLCLGLNNHHVGGYYWARSAGNGSSMEAPGVKFTDRGNDIGLLEWVHLDGAHKSNTNDGKRSEWVNFLRTGDQVQLIPTSVEDSLVEFIRYSDDREENCRVFGITTVDRPLGSDPVVLCSFRCDS